MRISKMIDRFFPSVLGAMVVCILFGGVLIPAAMGVIFTEIHVGKWIPTGQDVIVGVMATLPNSCTLFDGIESDMVPPNGERTGQLNIRVTVIPAPYNIEPEGASHLGCRNETYYVYEKVNFGPLPSGPYEVRIFENGVVGMSKKLNVSEFPVDPIFSEPGGFYNIGEAARHEMLFASHE